jgi:hypothetical protein
VDINQRVKNPRSSSWSCPWMAASAIGVPPVNIKKFATAVCYEGFLAVLMEQTFMSND